MFEGPQKGHGEAAWKVGKASWREGLGWKHEKVWKDLKEEGGH